MEAANTVFEVHPYDRRQPAITIRRLQGATTGAINLSSVAFNALGKPEAALLLFDSEGRRMAVKACKVDAPGAYPVNKHRKNNASIPATQFLNYYNILPEKSTRYRAERIDDMLVATL